MASRTRSAGESFRSIRAMRRDESEVLLSSVTRELSVELLCLPLACLYSRRACRLRAIFCRMQRLQYKFSPSLRARQTPNSESGKDSSHRGHLFNSISVTSANNVTFVSLSQW